MADLIDRGVLRDAVCRYGGQWYSDWETGGVLALIEKQPTIAAVPVVHARWITADPSDANSPVYCSNPKCNAFAIDVGSYGVSMYLKTRYCHQCGARMDADAPERAALHPCQRCGTQMPCPNGCDRQREYDAPERGEGSIL